MGLLDGGVASVFSSIMGAFFLDGSLYRWSTTEDGEGGGSSSFAAPEAIKAQLDSTARDSDDTRQRILVLASGVDPITPDDEIVVAGIRWAIENVTMDPASSYYELRGRLTAAGRT